MSDCIELSVVEDLRAARQRLQGHRLYDLVRSPEALRTFMEHHVVCVLDFMSLLKSLQQDLTGVAVPWTPPADSSAARLIHSIVLDEEADVRADGRVQSHFEWYLEAMEEVGAETKPVRNLVARLQQKASLTEALSGSALPAAARDFGLSTTGMLARPIHIRTAVFFHGREEIIPEMFLPIVEGIARGGLACEGLRSYLVRHVEIDGGEHGPLALQLLERLYAGDRRLRLEAENAALESLQARERLWDAIAEQCE